MKQTPLKRKTPLLGGGGLKRSEFKRVSPMRSAGRIAVSADVAAKPKRKARRNSGPEPEVRAIVRGRSGGWCELGLSGCTGGVEQQHHRLNRKFGGRHGEMHERINQAAWLVDSCARCHGLITSAKGAALKWYRRDGMLLMEGQDAREVPILTRHSPLPVLFDNLGGVTLSGVGATIEHADPVN